MTENDPIENRLTILAQPSKQPRLKKEVLLNKKVKHQKREELFYYGVFGFFGVFLAFIAPLWKKRLDRKLANRERTSHE